MPPSLPQEHVQRWVEQKRCKYALDVYYVSNLTMQDLVEVGEDYLKGVLGDTCLLQIVVQSGEDKNTQPWITHHFDKSFTLKVDHRNRTMKGSYLRVIFAYESDAYEENVEIYITSAINLLRYGLGAAVERAEALVYDLHTGTTSRTTNSIVPEVWGDGRTDNKFFENGVSSGFFSNGIATLNSAASILLNEALESHNKLHRFLFL